jgi:hypothetical protein
MASAQIGLAEQSVDFDFARTIEGRELKATGGSAALDRERTFAMTLPVSVRFRGLPSEDVEEIAIEIIGGSGLRVVNFSPATQLASDVADPIRVSTTTRKSSSLDASLGGTLPIPYAELVAHLTPTINAGTARGSSSTETLNRLPPQQAIIVSGTSSEGRGVFFKLKRSSQTSLEGKHELTVTFVAPVEWEDGTIRVACSARGQRRFLWLKQPATLGREVGDVKLRLLKDGAKQAVATNEVD